MAHRNTECGKGANAGCVTFGDAGGNGGAQGRARRPASLRPSSRIRAFPAFRIPVRICPAS